jgi:hypothetical protein
MARALRDREAMVIGSAVQIDYASQSDADSTDHSYKSYATYRYYRYYQ